MTKEDCRANALKCYRVAQKALDQDVRRTLLDLAVQWRELAAQIERLQSENAPEPALRTADAALEQMTLASLVPAQAGIQILLEMPGPPLPRGRAEYRVS